MSFFANPLVLFTLNTLGLLLPSCSQTTFFQRFLTALILAEGLILYYTGGNSISFALRNGLVHDSGSGILTAVVGMLFGVLLTPWVSKLFDSHQRQLNKAMKKGAFR